MSDHYEPTSHEYLYHMDRENLFTLFVGAVGSLKVDADGAHCLPVEAQGLSRLARAVQQRADEKTPRESTLGTMATVLRVLLTRTDSRDRGREPALHEMPLPELVSHFLALRGEVGDFIPAAAPVGVPDDLGSDPDEVSDVEEPGDDDIPTVEGGYLWHTDGRSPEPLD